MGRESLSSNHFSHEQQLQDVIESLDEAQFNELVKVFPCIDQGVVWDGSGWDYRAMSVDVDTPMFVTDWIEDNTLIRWEDGEPWLYDEAAEKILDEVFEDDDGEG